jgi:hypothetical protein
MHTAAMNYQLPVYLTFKQAHNLKAHVLKGEKAFPKVPVEALYPNAGDPIHALAQAVKDALGHEPPPAKR